MSATFRCDVCKDPDLDATYRLYPGRPGRRYIPGQTVDNADLQFAAANAPMTAVDREFDLCEACQLQYREIIAKFFGRK